jgi:hypothetical protein
MATLCSDAECIAEYKRLLASDWKRDFPDKVLRLLWSIVGDNRARPDGALLDGLLNPEESNRFPTDVFQGVLQRISELDKLIPLRRLPTLPSQLSIHKSVSKHTWHAARLSTYLTLAAHVPLSGNVELLIDAQALAFQAAIHFVLPGLKRRYPGEHSILLHSASLFPMQYVGYDVAHCLYMLSMIYDYVGDAALRLRYLSGAFRATSPDDHSFLTKAQEYSSALLDNGQNDAALSFLFELQRESLPAHQDEIREMIRVTVESIQRRKKGRQTVA